MTKTPKQQVMQILAAMIYGDERGFSLVYDYDGNNLVNPRQTENDQSATGSSLTDSEGTPVVART